MIWCSLKKKEYDMVYVGVALLNLQYDISKGCFVAEAPLVNY